jgi:hypothetical protein
MNAHQFGPTSVEERANCSTISPTRAHASMMSPSMRPTLVPSSRSTGSPRSGAFLTEPPVTQRSATVHPRFEAVARQDAKNLVAIMRQSVQVLGALVDERSTLAGDAMADIRRTLDRLENRIGSWSQPQSR